MTTSEITRSQQELRGLLRDLPFFKLLGLEFVEAEPGRSITRISMRPDLAQPAGLMHGGVIASLIDTGTAYALLLREEIQDALRDGGSLVTVDLRVKYLRPVADGIITCEARVIRMGRQIIHTDAVVTNEAGAEVARGDAIYTTARTLPTSSQATPYAYPKA